MADKILPQRVSAFHRSPQRIPSPTPSPPPLPPLAAPPSLPPLPLRSRASAVTVSFIFCFKGN